ncbi:hypothetical protein TrRE_jg2242, partial [Triparma retinervis]
MECSKILPLSSECNAEESGVRTVENVTRSLEVDDGTRTSGGNDEREEYAHALNINHDGVLTATDVIDSAFYLGIKLTPQNMKLVLKELKGTGKEIVPGTEKKSTPGDLAAGMESPLVSLDTQSSSSCDACPPFDPQTEAVHDLPTTRHVFQQMSPRDIYCTILSHRRLVTHKSLPMFRHILLRGICTVLGINFVPAINAIFTPIRHKAESLVIQHTTLQVATFAEGLALILLRIPSAIVVAFHGPHPLFVRTFVVSSVMGLIVFMGPHIRESAWFCKRQRARAENCKALGHRLRFLNMKTLGNRNQSAFLFLQRLARRVGEEEIVASVLAAPSLFDAVSNGAGGEGSQRLSLKARATIATDRHSEKYAVKSATQVIPVAVSLFAVFLFAWGWSLERGSSLDKSLQTAAQVQVALACLYVFLLVAIFVKAFIIEAVVDFWRHNRLVAHFLHFVGAFSDVDLACYGYHLEHERDAMLINEAHKVVLETPEDLASMFACYDFIMEYLKLRCTFHNGFVAFLIIINVMAALSFLLSTLYDSFAIGPLAQIMLFAFASLSSISMVVVTIPLTRTSFMVQDSFLKFLLERSLFFDAELASPINAFLSATEKNNYVRQISLCQTKIRKMSAQDEHIKILGVTATSGTVLKLLAVVGG